MSKKKNQKEIEKIARRYNLSLILAFGSQITGKIHPDSDLDIAVLGKKILNQENYSALLFDLIKIFPEKEIDLVIINHADPLLLKKVLENCRLLYGSKRGLANLKMYSFSRYCDYQKYFNLEEKFVHQFIKSL